MHLGISFNRAAPSTPTAPTVLRAPQISGGDIVGNVWTVSGGEFTGSPTLTYQWRNESGNISGATAATRTIVAGDVDQFRYCRVTATNAQGSVTVDTPKRLACKAPVNTFYVRKTGNDSTGDGSTGSPWLTVTHALANRWYDAGGETIIVGPGVYAERFAPYNDSATGYVTIKAEDPADKPIFDGTGLAAGDSIAPIYGRRIRLESLAFRDSASSGISLYAETSGDSGDLIQIIDCDVDNVEQSGIILFAESTDRGAISRNVVRGCTVSNFALNNSARSAGSGWARGIAIDNAVNCVVESNKVHSGYGEGLGCLGSTGCEYTHNTVYDAYSVGIYTDNVSDFVATDNRVFATDSAYYRDFPTAGTLFEPAIPFMAGIEDFPPLIYPDNFTVQRNFFAPAIAPYVGQFDNGIGEDFTNSTLTPNTLAAVGTHNPAWVL